MYRITGILKKEEVEKYTRNDGTQGQSKYLYIELPDTVYPIKVKAPNAEYKVGKVGETVTVGVEMFPFTIVDKKRKKAFIDIYIPSEQK